MLDRKTVNYAITSTEYDHTNKMQKNSKTD